MRWTSLLMVLLFAGWSFLVSCTSTQMRMLSQTHPDSPLSEVRHSVTSQPAHAPSTFLTTRKAFAKGRSLSFLDYVLVGPIAVAWDTVTLPIALILDLKMPSKKTEVVEFRLATHLVDQRGAGVADYPVLFSSPSESQTLKSGPDGLCSYSGKVILPGSVDTWTYTVSLTLGASSDLSPNNSERFASGQEVDLLSPSDVSYAIAVQGDRMVVERTCNVVTLSPGAGIQRDTLLSAWTTDCGGDLSRITLSRSKVRSNHNVWVGSEEKRLAEEAQARAQKEEQERWTGAQALERERIKRQKEECPAVYRLMQTNMSMAGDSLAHWVYGTRNIQDDARNISKQWDELRCGDWHGPEE